MTASDSFAAARAAFAGIAMPVAVAASTDGTRQAWATVTLMYVSFVPPQVAVALLPGSHTLELARASGELSLSLLAASQQEIAMAAGRRQRSDEPAYAPPETIPAPEGFATAGVQGSLAVLWCRVSHEIPTEDHVVLVATVVHQSDSGSDGDVPLLRFQRRYHALGRQLSEPSPEGYPI